MLDQRAQEILDDPPFSGFDFDRDRHARRQVDGLFFYLHRRARQGDPGRINQAFLFVANRIARDMGDFAVQGAVFGVGKGFDLDFGFLAGIDKADVFVFDEGFDLQDLARRHHDHQGLGRRHDAADGMHRQLLHDAVDRRGQRQQLPALPGFDAGLSIGFYFLFAVVQSVQRVALGAGQQFVLLFDRFQYGRLQFLLPFPLCRQFAFLFDAGLFPVQVVVVGNVVAAVQFLVVFGQLPDDGHRFFQFVDGGTDRAQGRLAAVFFGLQPVQFAGQFVLFAVQQTLFAVAHQGRTASYPTAPSQIPACGITAPGSSERLASHESDTVVLRNHGKYEA